MYNVDDNFTTLHKTVVYYSTIRSLYSHVVCNVLISCKANEDRNQWAWLDSDLKRAIWSS